MLHGFGEELAEHPRRMRCERQDTGKGAKTHGGDPNHAPDQAGN